MAAIPKKERKRRSRAGAIQVLLAPEEKAERVSRARVCRLALTARVRRLTLDLASTGRLHAEQVRELALAPGALICLAARFDVLPGRPGLAQDPVLAIRTRSLTHESRRTANKLDRFAEALATGRG